MTTFKRWSNLTFTIRRVRPRLCNLDQGSVPAAAAAGSYSWRDDVAFKIRTGNFWGPGVPEGYHFTCPGTFPPSLDHASLFVPIVEGVFDAMCTCRIVGLN